MPFDFFVGIDVSKPTIDCTLLKEGNFIEHQQIPNTLKAIDGWFKIIVKRYSLTVSTVLFCMEHTGIYNAFLLDYLTQRNVPLWLETSLRIKQSMGMQRGKTDKVDSRRIALYAFRHQDQVNLWKEQREVIKKLKGLITLRMRLQTIAKQLKTPLNESKSFSKAAYSKSMASHCASTLSAVKKDLQKTNASILKMIREDEYLSHLFSLCTSVASVGKVTAAEMIVSTNEFKNFTNARKFACYSGVAPFEHSSGKSIRKKSRVSHMANKRMKQLLHLSAMSAIVHPGELNEYFKRRTEMGHNKMSTLNAIRNKIIHRIFAVIRDNRPYQKNYLINVV